MKSLVLQELLSSLLLTIGINPTLVFDDVRITKSYGSSSIYFDCLVSDCVSKKMEARIQRALPGAV